jgi:hypothetical protein
MRAINRLTFWINSFLAALLIVVLGSAASCSASCEAAFGR